MEPAAEPAPFDLSDQLTRRALDEFQKPPADRTRLRYTGTPGAWELNTETAAEPRWRAVKIHDWYCSAQYPNGSPPGSWTEEAALADHLQRADAIVRGVLPADEPLGPKYDPPMVFGPPVERPRPDGGTDVLSDGVTDSRVEWGEPDAIGGQTFTVTLDHADGRKTRHRTICRICGGDVKRRPVTR